MWTRSRFPISGSTAIVLALTAPAARGTWSIVIADSHTKELAAGIVTCNTGGDLLSLVQLAVGKGVGVCQAASDPDGSRRPIIFEGLAASTAPQNILNKLAKISGHDDRQYGIADTKGRVTTFTGSSTAPWTGGVVGSHGTMVYAIQGNILVGSCVVPAIERALRDTSGDVPAKLMAGLQEARLAGGDRRCSCPDKSNPADCGCPPPNFTKSGHRGSMLVARIGDPDHIGSNSPKPKDDARFLRLIVTCQNPEEKPDPVDGLQKQFDEWRAGLVGRPDAVQSLVEFTPPTVKRGGSGTARVLITIHDWRRRRVTGPIRSLSVKHASESAGISKVGEIRNNGDGTFTVALTTGEGLGTDSLLVTVDDGVRPVILMPNPSLRYVGQPDP
ncbi:MAG: DUF1028 domain-containing protein [Phycisphaerales bacterium]|nr:MAG: DUF1028 domain-containing protein [Phycisphaerales bacterium]